jgi:hypothetical protein
MRRTRAVAFLATPLLLLGCGGSLPSSDATFAPPSAAATGEATIGPSEAAPSSAPGETAAATPSVRPTTAARGVFAPGSAYQVSVAGLKVREQPSTSAKEVATLPTGSVVVISPSDGISFGWGPVKANGYTWYPVIQVAAPSAGTLPALPSQPVDLTSSHVTGWAAAGDATEPYLTPVAARCPSKVNLTNVNGMLPAERLACFGTKSFTLQGTFGCGGCGGAVQGTYTPEWLAFPLEFNFLSVKPETRVGPIALRFPPDGPALPAAGSIIKVTVHVDDARSSTCSLTEVDVKGNDAPVNHASGVLYCRERLVVESYDILGTDPNFPLS